MTSPTLGQMESFCTPTAAKKNVSNPEFSFKAPEDLVFKYFSIATIVKVKRKYVFCTFKIVMFLIVNI